MKLVTDRKLVAASRALLVLADCDDIDTVLHAHWLKVIEAHEERTGHHMPEVDEPPHSGWELLQVAAALSQIAQPE